MKTVSLFNNKIILNISEEDWSFLCNNRLFSEYPNIDEIQTEFVTGTGITENKLTSWKEADVRFAEYVQELREIREGDKHNVNEHFTIEAPYKESR